MSIGIVIVTYNSEQYIRACLDSLLDQEYLDIQVLVWDNASCDNTARLINQYPSITAVICKENVGFARACTEGTKQLLSRGCSMILYINPDTVAAAGFLDTLVTGMQAADSDIAQPSILLFDRQSVNNTGNSLHYLGFSFCQHYQEPFQVGSPGPITVASGACMLVKREVFETVGYFDQTFFAYHEDTDLSWRAQLAGFTIFHVPDAVIYHDYRFRLKGIKYLLLERNRVSMLLKNYSLKSLVLLLPAMLFLEVQLLVYSLEKGWLHWKILSYFQVLRNVSKIYHARQLVQKSRKVPDRTLFNKFMPTLECRDISNLVIRYFSNPVFNLTYGILKKVI